MDEKLRFKTTKLVAMTFGSYFEGFVRGAAVAAGAVFIMKRAGVLDLMKQSIEIAQASKK